MFNNKIKNNFYRNSGQVMIIFVVLFLIISIIIITGIVNPTIRNIKVAKDLFLAKQSLYLADSGMADAVYRVKNNIAISNQEYLLINNNIATTTILDTIEGKTISSASNYLNYFRKIQSKIIKGDGVSFFYGVQAGQGGFSMSGSSQVNGNIYSNGPISGGIVTGSAISAGVNGSIRDTKIGQNGIGEAQAHTVTGVTVAGALKCKIGSDNNKICDTSVADPDLISMPISGEQIIDWKDEAEAGQTIIGNYSPSEEVILGPVKITGDFTIKKKVIMTGTIWIEGKLLFSGGSASIVLATSTYDNKSGVVIIDKYTNFTGGSQVFSTGITGSYVMLLITSDCPVSEFCSGNNAVSESGNAGSVVLAAPYGTISFGGGASAKEIVADKVILSGSASIDYEMGLASQNFVSGPSGSYNLISFKEIE